MCNTQNKAQATEETAPQASASRPCTSSLFLTIFSLPVYWLLCYNRCLKLKQQIRFLSSCSFLPCLTPQTNILHCSLHFFHLPFSRSSKASRSLSPPIPYTCLRKIILIGMDSLETHLIWLCWVLDLMHTLLQLSPLLGICLVSLLPLWQSLSSSLVPQGFVQL